MLLTLLLLPLLGSIFLSFTQEGSSTTVSVSGSSSSYSPTGLKGGINCRQIALFTSLVVFIVSLVLWSEFDGSTSEYQFTQEYFSGENSSFLHLKLGVDGISLYFVLLTTFITPICILSNWDNISFANKENEKLFLSCFLVLESLLLAVFTVCDILLFYIFFESVLLPLFLVVGIWGGSAGRVRAAFLLFLYTLFGSLFMLLSFLGIYYHTGSTDFQVVSLCEMDLNQQKLLWLGIFLSMAIKTPLLPFHVWLPRAHAEAPLAGSVILAGLILKLATYGYMRILLQFLPDASSYYSPLVETIACITLVYASLATLRQTDFKALVAYSSIGHMAVVVLGLFSNTIQGMDGAILLSIAHGVVSPALFILVGGVLYDRYHTRIIRYYRGVTAYMPLFSLFFFLFTIFNAAVPLSANWAGEFLSLTGAFQRNPIMASIGSTGIVLSAAYSIWLYNRVAFGAVSPFISFSSPVTNYREFEKDTTSFSSSTTDKNKDRNGSHITTSKVIKSSSSGPTDLTRREFMLLLPLLFVAVLFGIFPNIVLDQIHASTSMLLYSN